MVAKGMFLGGHQELQEPSLCPSAAGGVFLVRADPLTRYQKFQRLNLPPPGSVLLRRY